MTALCSAAVEVTVEWDSSTVDIGGNPLNETPTYKLFYGEAPGVYTDYAEAGTGTLTTVTGLDYETTYFFAAKAYTESAESAYSEEMQWDSPPPPVVVTAITISGPESVEENSSAQYTCTASYSDGSTQTVAPVWSENRSFTTIDSSGLLTASSVSSDRSVTITAVYDGFNDTHAVTIVDVPPVLTGLTISGPASVDEDDTAQYTCTANYDDGSTQTVTPVWGDNSPFASINGSGLLTASSVTTDQSVIVTAAYGGFNDTHAVTIVDAPPVVTSLTISGPASVDEGDTAQYTCTASYDDGSTQTVDPAWSENSPYASINESGLLTASTVTADQSVTVTATYGGQNDTHAVTIEVLPPEAPTNVSPSDQAMNVERTVTLEWTEVASAAGYEVWFGESPGEMSKISTQTAESYYTGLRRPGRTFWWQITATNEAGSATGGPWSFTTLNEETIEEALGTVNQEWNTSGAAEWFVQTDVTHDGISAMQSGAIAAGQESVLETTVVGPGTISFWWRVSSEANGDFLNFYTNASLQTCISGMEGSGDGWIQESFPIDRGTQQLTWTYEKNGSGVGGDDAGWLDEVQWLSANTTTFPLSGFTGKWIAFYLWDNTDQIWIPLGQEFEPEELLIQNIKPERWYWLSVMEYDAATKTWSAVHGSWINHWDEI